MKREKDANRGFSLIELIIVVAILAVLTALLAPQYFQYVEKSRKRVCFTNISTMTRMAVIARNLGENKTEKELLQEALDESYPTDKHGCPSGGKYEVIQKSGALGTDKWYISCPKHGPIPDLGDSFAIGFVTGILGNTTKSNLDSGAMGFDLATSKAVDKALQDEGYDLAAMGAVSWKYDNINGLFYWTDEDISPKNNGDIVYVLRYNENSETYTVWKATVKSHTETSINKDPYNILNDFKNTNETKLPTNQQTYENAWALLKALQNPTP